MTYEQLLKLISNVNTTNMPIIINTLKCIMNKMRAHRYMNMESDCVDQYFKSWILKCPPKTSKEIDEKIDKYIEFWQR